MKKDVVIKVENLSKKYQIGEKQAYMTLRDQLMTIPQKIFKKKNKTKDFWALKNISFEIKKGEVIGIIGRNGAGKSTLLKILSRIVEPTMGKIIMRGRIASLLEVGTGFNPELTGRDNIYLNGAILGMSKQEIESKFDEIVRFSGVGKFLDTPVKKYSSGMYVRLAFAIAAHLDTDILLVDEVLAVGDIEFQKKCLMKMGDLAKSGKTIIFISHNLTQIINLCKKTILLENGKVKLFLKTKEVIENYINNYENTNDFTNFKNKKINLISIKLVNNNNKKIERLKLKEELNILINIEFLQKLKNPNIGIALNSNLFGRILTSHLVDSNLNVENGEFLGKYEFLLKFKNLNLSSGSYYLTLGVRNNLGKNIFLRENVFKINIQKKIEIKDGSEGILSVKPSWMITKETKQHD